MGKKYFAWSFDDGLEQDRRIVQILKTYRMGGTFHLNSGLFGDQTYEGRIGNLGMMETPADEFRKKKFHLLPYAEHFRLEKEEAVQLYEGFEVASHTKHHVNVKKCGSSELEEEIVQDVKDLSEIFGRKVTGFAYPYGVSSESSAEYLKKAGVKYARVVKSDDSFRFPEDPYHLPMTCWHIKKNALKLIDDFINAELDEDLFFLMFAHGYEFDFGTNESNWQKFEAICQKVSSSKDIICLSTGEAIQRHKAAE